MVLGGNIATLFLIRINLIRIKLIGDNHGGHVGGSNWMFLMEGDVGCQEIIGRGNILYTKVRVSLATL
jgi:hypothetical protein